VRSPFSPDYADPTDPTVGDQHPWGVSLRQNGPTDWWAYREYVDRFPNEGGVLGASSPATLRQFLPEGQRHVNSLAWEHHDNPFAMQPMTPGQRGRIYQTITLWTGRDPATMPLDDYAILSGLLQAEGLTEYINNYRRRMFSSSAAIFWMYNDSWPTTHGWSIVDYYRRKKLAYHPVRRAFQPVSVVIAEGLDEEKETQFFGFVINDTELPFVGRLDQGSIAHPTRQSFYRSPTPVTVAPHSVGAFFADNREILDVYGHGGIAAVLYDSEGRMVCQNRWFERRFHELELAPHPEIEMRLENGVLRLWSNVFVWGVCLDVDGERPVADNAFDLLPNVPYSLPWDEAVLGPPKILATGNGLLHRTV
jgi:beta-mannosidase